MIDFARRLKPCEPHELREPDLSFECLLVMHDVALGLKRWRQVVGGAGVILGLAGCYHAPEKSARLDGSISAVNREVGGDSYVYYPAYEVYYNTTRRQYVYRDGRSWVNRPVLPRAWAKNLARTPQVPLEFHDAPEKHHGAVAREYPHDWHSESSKNIANDATR